MIKEADEQEEIKYEDVNLDARIGIYQTLVKPTINKLNSDETQGSYMSIDGDYNTPSVKTENIDDLPL